MGWIPVDGFTGPVRGRAGSTSWRRAAAGFLTLSGVEHSAERSTQDDPDLVVSTLDDDVAEAAAEPRR